METARREDLDEHVVPPGALAVHADLDLVFREHAGESRTRELRTLIGVEDLRPPMPGQSILQRLDAERGLHRDGHAPRIFRAASLRVWSMCLYCRYRPVG